MMMSEPDPMRADPGPDPQLAMLLAKLREMRQRGEHIHGELSELEGLVRRYQSGEDRSPQAPPQQPTDDVPPA